MLRFLTRQKSTLGHYSNWTLEIISPFFAEDPKNIEHKAFFKLEVKQIHMLLPTDEEGNALCHQPDYYTHINNQDNVCWAEWQKPMQQALGLGGEHFRRLHAKIYHFYNKMQSWVFCRFGELQPQSP